ncbi:DNA/RNA non-specific endonuclease [Luteimonas sp. MC1572]|uniref:DNA/RNA non-specific endonuclease n=1 Tax=Luteimonas sp. MC1572 TaxID=2799325 RepID=UPI0018F091A5|nr:DNA/RNA non-specific endonuclease [Luteimonas sp. MC1572]MBJ6982135.1 DNA/RNA non-specific endonuclease [Luteimonas sp. MC1572]QQO03423.1 DNA/RNA non-specific endonuclease [Luteimonas sp. MC1572]
MSLETHHLLVPMPPPQPWRGLEAFLSGAQGGKPATLDPALLDAAPGEVSFDLDAGSVRISDEKTGQHSTTYSADGDMTVRGPDGATTGVPLRYEASLRNADATPAAMQALNPFDPATIPLRARIEVHGADYTGTALEPAFRNLADANGLASIDDLRLSLEMTEKGQLRVMTGSEQLFDAPRDGGPGSDALDRQDFTRHTTMLSDPAGADRAEYTRMLLTGQVPGSTVVLAEDVAPGEVRGTVTEAGSGEVNDITWSLDAEGRPTGAEAVLTWEPSSKGRDSDRIETSAQSRFRTDNDMKGTPDDVGHVFAYRFANGHGEVNMFPQFGLFNRGAYAKMEQEWSDWLGTGMEVRIDIDLVRNGGHRPEEVHVDYEVIDPATGTVVYDPALIAFANADGQSFDAIAAKQMPGIIDRANA